MLKLYHFYETFLYFCAFFSDLSAFIRLFTLALYNPYFISLHLCYRSL